jgi:transketolase
MGTVFVRGTVPTANLVSVLSELDRAGVNVKIVAAISSQLFRLQDARYRDRVVSAEDRWDAMCITSGAYRLMHDWIDGPLAAEYSLSSDWDDRWRTGGSLDEVMDEAHLSSAHILAGIERFASERDERLRCLRALVDGVAAARGATVGLARPNPSADLVDRGAAGTET